MAMTWQEIKQDDTRRPLYQHEEALVLLTVARQTEIRMPMTDEETIFTALFVLEDDVPINVRSYQGALKVNELFH
ncbi:unnamed protein product [Aureobasidium vineae]|uniref:Uncharacterized protein n=1 Tax=Aureobasidium vineae TaxID=2773715 RepID=A0A9N8PDT4_9PEZI|nr:unnamed protein product [Aureobasidium vineae]